MSHHTGLCITTIALVHFIEKSLRPSESFRHIYIWQINYSTIFSKLLHNFCKINTISRSQQIFIIKQAVRILKDGTLTSTEVRELSFDYERRAAWAICFHKNRIARSDKRVLSLKKGHNFV